nr:proline dehydrogenase [Cryptococcus depauperatus CBS 7841]
MRLMMGLLRWTAALQPAGRHSQHRLVSSPRPWRSSSKSTRRMYLTFALLPAGVFLFPAISAGPPLVEDSSLADVSFASLLRQWFVWASCSAPGAVDYSPALLKFISATPLRASAEWIIRRTFFEQFVLGETVEECIPALEDLRRSGIGAILNYSAEVDESQLHETGLDQDKKKQREEKMIQVLHALEKAGEYEKSLPVEERGVTGFALKITGLVDCNVLQRASYTLLRLRPLTKSSSPMNSSRLVPYPGTPETSDERIVARSQDLGPGTELLSLQDKLDEMGVLDSDEGLREGDIEELRELWCRLKMISQKAKDNGVCLFVDAEHTWYQPVLDAYTLLLSQEFNRPSKDGSWTGPLIFGTFQSYLCRQPAHLCHAIEHAEANGYALGVKLVRGAYFEQERKKWLDEGRNGADPIWPHKADTDNAYNESISTLMATLAFQLKSAHPERALSVIFGTHNANSCNLLCDTLVQNGLAEEKEGKLKLREDVRGRVKVAQLYGMKDNLTFKIANRFVNDGKPVALKYVAYGRLAEVMPFLGRRAIENKSLMSGKDGAAAERIRVGVEIRRRIFGWV